MRKSLALLAVPAISLGLVVTAAMPAEAASWKIKAKNEKKSYTGIILHGTNDGGGKASSVKAPALVLEPGETKKGKLKGKNCAVWIPAHSELSAWYTAQILTPPVYKRNKTSKGYDWVFEKGDACSTVWTTWHFRLNRL